MVCGWFAPEMEMFGSKMMEHDIRYDYAAEWIEVVEKFWTEQYFDHEGKYFKINDGFQLPKPYQDPRPVLISAGTSGKGRHFAAKYCDFNFAAIESIEWCREWVKDIKNLAKDHYQREIGTFTYCNIVCRDTEKEAKDYYHYYVHEKGDWEAADNLCKVMGLESGSFTLEFLQNFKKSFIAGWVGLPVVGTPEQVAETLVELSATGVDGSLITMVDYNAELPYWNEKVMPLLEQAGLRQPVKKNGSQKERS